MPTGSTIPNQNGYMPGYVTPVNWFIYNPPATPVDTWVPPPLPSVNGTGPYIQEFSLTPSQAFQLYIQDAHIVEILIDIFVEGVGMGPSAIAPLGTPGQLMPFATGGSPVFEYGLGANFQLNGELQYPGTFGGEAPGSFTTGIHPKFLNVKPKKRKKPKKAWFLNPTGQ